MATRRHRSTADDPIDPELDRIAALERDIVRAHDERVSLGGAPADEIAAQRPAVVQLAKNVADRLRAEYRGRSGAKP